jgi:multiple sugar transport system ATP-binding protein
MDEPLGALDADFRESMRPEIKQLHIDQEATTVYVTHDQVEAMAMGDRIVVMSDAEIQQVGTPSDVYYDPANLFVANFIGSPGMNLIEGRFAENTIHLPGDNHYPVPAIWQSALQKEFEGEGDVTIGFRPEAAQINDDGALVGEVYATEMYGAYTILHVRMNGNNIVHIRGDRQTRYPIGTTVHFDLNPEMTRFFNPETEMALNKEGVL